MDKTGEAAPARRGEDTTLHTRSDRFFQKDGSWYYITREGVDMGPYHDKAEAQLALAYFVERTQWPDPRELRRYLQDMQDKDTD